MRDSVLKHKDAARRAAQGISLDPERFGQSLMQDLDNGLTLFLAQIPAEMHADYEARYIEKTLQWWGAMSRCFSVMVTGAGNFNNRRHEKTNAAEHNARQRLFDWAARVIKRANAQTRLRGWDEVERLQNKLDQRTELQEQMKAANKIIRNGKLSEMEKLDELMALGLSQANANLLLTPNCFGGLGFAQYQLSNNNAEIRRLSGLIEQKTRNLGKTDETRDYAFGSVEFNYTGERINVTFDGKPSPEACKVCKAHGFHWSPSHGNWTRQLTNSALFSTNHYVIPELTKLYGNDETLQ